MLICRGIVVEGNRCFFLSLAVACSKHPFVLCCFFNAQARLALASMGCAGRQVGDIDDMDRCNLDTLITYCGEVDLNVLSIIFPVELNRYCIIGMFHFVNLFICVIAAFYVVKVVEHQGRVDEWNFHVFSSSETAAGQGEEIFILKENGHYSSLEMRAGSFQSIREAASREQVPGEKRELHVFVNSYRGEFFFERQPSLQEWLQKSLS